MASDNSLTIVINGTAEQYLKELDKVKKQTESIDKVLDSVAKGAGIAFAALSATIAVTVRDYAKYETALVGVGKTTDIEGDRLKAFGKEFQRLSSDIPLATNELLGIAQAAGQLGVEGEKDLLKFTRTVAKLGVSTDLSGEEAATALTRILNVTNESISTIDTFGSVIVALGNNFAATESEIVRMTTEVSRSTTVFGVSSAEAAALGTALKSVGVQAQLGGSAVGRAFRAIDKSIREGGKAFSNLQILTGLTGDQLKKTFEEDAISVFQSFIEGLDRIDQAGGSTTEALEAFNLKGDEILKVLPVLAKNSSLVGEALNTANKEVKQATAPNNEAAKAFSTLESEGQKLLNNFTTLRTNIGEQLAPQITELVKGTSGLVKELANADKETLGIIASLIKWATLVSGAILSTALLAKGFLKLRAAALVARTAVVGLVSSIGAVPLGILAGIAAGFAGVVKVLRNVREENAAKVLGQSLEEVTDKLNKLKAVRAEYAKTSIDNPNFAKLSADRIERLDSEIAKYEELRKKKLEADKDFGSGALLARPTDEGLTAPDFGQPEGQDVNIPLRVNAESDTDDLKSKLEKENEIKANALDNEIETKQAKLLTKEELEKEARNREIQAENEKQLRILEDTRKYGETYAKINSVIQSKEVQGAKTAADALVSLSDSKNSKLKEIGKAASIVQIGISTAEGAIKAYAALAGIPVVGPALGTTAAAAVIAYGAEREAEVLGLQGGGQVPTTVPQAIGGRRDRFLTALEPEEIVIPKRAVPDFQQQFGQLSDSSTTEENTNQFVQIGFTENAFEIIEQKLEERQALGIA